MAEIVRTIRAVELVKQLKPPLTDQQVTALALELDKLNLSSARLQEMAETVKRANTYGNIALEHWLDGQLLTPEELAERYRQMCGNVEQMHLDFKWEVEKEIRRRIQMAKEDKADPLTKELMSEVQTADEIVRLRIKVEELERVQP